MHHDRELKRAPPESQGVRSAAISSFVREADREQLGLHSLMILRHGQVVAEGWWKPYERTRPHMMFSVSKSFTATAIGIAESEGRLSVDEPILAFFPSYATDWVKQNVRDLRVRHLLSMATGHDVDTMEVMRAQPAEDWVKIFLEVPVIYPPGSHFLYNSGASFVLSAIIASRTGQHVKDYLESRLFAPLGIDLPPWETNPRGIEYGASGLRLRTEELAKFGQLYLQRGEWNGKQLLPDSWIEAATSVQAHNGTDPDDDWSQGYGFQFWRSRHNSFRADGRYGQFSFVLPEQDAVVAITAGTAENKGIARLLWAHLLGGMEDAPLAEDKRAQEALAQQLDGLHVPLPEFLNEVPTLAPAVSGRTMLVPFNTLDVSRLTLTFGDDRVTLAVETSNNRNDAMEAGYRSWIEGVTRLWPYEEMSSVTVESRAGWTTASKLEIHQQCVDTPFRRVWRFDFSEDNTATVTVGLDNGFWVERTEVLSCTFDPQETTA